ncbi:tryptophan 2-monooxygenase [Paraburkholderia lacunae]|uniref:Tryptophan 2-monooxygenase n=2 Tax=Paraburkholderia lacunae TaxID=2211104 RepID=A0A370MWT7_9BURK|nr:tryptophan 2-monooxygenase [Paraburkholderia lacunae]
MRRRVSAPVAAEAAPLAATAQASFGYIDTLFDYGALLAGSPDSLGSLPPSSAGKTIAIIGAGIGGLVSVYELLRAGASNVVIYEASGRIGGRAHSATFTEAAPECLAELGAMRFPPSEYSLFHYLDRFGIKANSSFPDPGAVLTDLGYQGQAYTWPAHGNPPTMFATVHAGWNAFISDGYTPASGPALMAPVAITALLRANQLGAARAAWQTYIDVFGNQSFYSALRTIFSGSNPPGGTPWRFPDDFQLFGALGVGSGGLGPMYPVAFLEIVRLMVNELETDQLFIPAGIESLARAFSSQVFEGRSLGDRVEQIAVSRVSRTAEGVMLTLDDGSLRFADRVIVTASTRAMQLDMALSASPSALSAQQCSAIDDVHLTSSSKVFVMTKRKFWLDGNLPANIQTDTLVRGVYCLDYAPDDRDAPGVVLLSYAWEDDAIKQLALGSNQQRVQRLVADLAQTNPAFAAQVVPIDGDYETYVKIVDWDLQRGYYGAFKLNFADGDAQSQQLFFQFQDCREPQTDPFVYLAGDSCSFTGGWVEGALQTGINAVCAVIRSLGGKLSTAMNPIDAMSPPYRYGGTSAATEPSRAR